MCYQFFQEFSKNFSITTDASLDFQFFLSKKTFIGGEIIYLNYSSSISNLDIQATLTYPDLTTPEISFPFSIKAEQIGTYTLEVKTTKEEYKDVFVRDQFAVIEKQAEIQDANFSNYPIVSVSVGEKKHGKNLNWIYYMLGTLLVLAVVGILIILLIRRRNLTKFL